MLPYWGSLADRKTLRRLLSPARLYGRAAPFHVALTSYQIAVAEGGFKAHHASTTSSGAALIYLGHDIQKTSSREQGVIDLQEARAEIENIAQSMGAAQFVAATNSRCKECPVKSSCPIKAEGRTVIE